MQVVSIVRPRGSGLDMATIARDHYEAVFRFCARRVGTERAADVAQETFLTAQRALPKYRGESALSTWLFGIANNECRRVYRQSRGEPVYLDLETAPIGTSDSEGQLVDREALRRALLTLSDEHREVVLLHEMEGLTYEEIATIVNVPAGTVKSRLHHAFLNLRRELSPAKEVR